VLSVNHNSFLKQCFLIIIFTAQITEAACRMHDHFNLGIQYSIRNYKAKIVYYYPNQTFVLTGSRSPLLFLGHCRTRIFYSIRTLALLTHAYYHHDEIHLWNAIVISYNARTSLRTVGLQPYYYYPHTLRVIINYLLTRV